MLYGPTNFRSTVVKPYYADGSAPEPPQSAPHSDTLDDLTIIVDTGTENNAEHETANGPIVKKRGQGRLRKNTTFLTEKEKTDFDLSLKLRREGVITTPRQPFELSDKKEIDALVAQGVFAFEQYDKHKHGGQIFKSRIVREIKGKSTPSPYEKSRLVIQAYNDA
jgi:hypothetical protein